MAVKTAKNELLSSGKLDLDGIELASPMLCQRSRVRFPPQFISLPRVNTLRAGGCQLGGGGGCPDCPTAFHVRTTFVIFPKLEGGGGGRDYDTVREWKLAPVETMKTEVNVE